MRESFEEDEVAFSWYWADVQIDHPVDSVKRAEQQRKNEARIAIDGAGQCDA